MGKAFKIKAFPTLSPIYDPIFAKKFVIFNNILWYVENGYHI